MSWFFLSIGSIIALAIAELSQQKILNDKNAISPRASLVLTWAIQAVFAFLVILISNQGHEIIGFFNDVNLYLLALLLILSYFSNYFYFKSFQVKNISISVIFISTSIFVSTSIGMLFFGETSYPIKYIGLALIFLSIVLLNLRRSIIEKNHIYGLLAGWMFGILYSIDKSLVTQSSPMVYAFWAFLSLSLVNLIVNPISSIKSITYSFKNNFYIIQILFLSCIGYFLYNFLTYNAYSVGGEVGRIDAINNTYVFIIIMYEYFILRHTQGIYIKIASSFIAIFGVLVLGFL